MQVAQADDKKVKKVGVEDFIKFRPSPNFKNMKKFLKNRSDYTTDTTSLVNHKEAATPEPTPAKANQEKVHLKETKPVVVQPPLPPYPPPPDSPPNLKLIIKQEKKDDEVENSPCTTEPEVNIEQNLTKVDKQVPDRPREPKRTMCKEFIRGNCKRPVCKFAHEVDVSQLDGVFTFCWDYQNAVCTFPNCRYVHATIFEAGEFFRTGILPPHIRRQMKQQALPPPPPPEETQQDNIRVNFTNPPPFHPNVEKQKPVITCVPTSNIEARPDDSFRTIVPVVPRSTSPLKREWREIEEFSSAAPRDIEYGNNHIANKKCKNCDIMEFSIKYNKEMVENMLESAEDVNKKLSQLNKKTSKLFNVLMTLLKPMGSNKSILNKSLMSSDKDKSVLEHLDGFLGPSNPSSLLLNEENLKNLVGSNMNLSCLMAKLLCGSGDPALSTDTSRET